MVFYLNKGTVCLPFLDQISCPKGKWRFFSKVFHHRSVTGLWRIICLEADLISKVQTLFEQTKIWFIFCVCCACVYVSYGEKVRERGILPIITVLLEVIKLFPIHTPKFTEAELVETLCGFNSVLRAHPLLNIFTYVIIHNEVSWNKKVNKVRVKNSTECLITLNCTMATYHRKHTKKQEAVFISK